MNSYNVRWFLVVTIIGISEFWSIISTFKDNDVDILEINCMVLILDFLWKSLLYVVPTILMLFIFHYIKLRNIYMKRYRSVFISKVLNVRKGWFLVEWSNVLYILGFDLVNDIFNSYSLSAQDKIKLLSLVSITRFLWFLGITKLIVFMSMIFWAAMWLLYEVFIN